MNYSLDLEKIGRQLFPYYLLIIFVAPIPYGSNRPWAWAILAFASFLLLFIYLWNYSKQKLRPPELTFDVKLIFALLCAWFSYQVFQLVPLPIELLRLISPHTIDLKQHVLGSQDFLYLPISIDIASGWKLVLKSALYISLFVLTICLVQSRERLRMLLFTIVIIGVVQAVWGMSSAFIEQELMIYRNDFQDVNGTFVNRNHFGGFMNLAIAALIGLLLASGIKEKRRIHRDKFRHHWQSRTMDWRIFLIPYFGIMLFALILSQSRGAFFSFICMLFILFGCLFYSKIGVRVIYRSFKLPIWIIVFVVFFSGANFLSLQIADLGDSFATRLDHWKNSLAIISDYNLVGVGAGNFQNIFPLYDSGYVDYRLIHAHNDYLELLVEQGVVGFILLTSIVLLCIKNAIQAIRRFPRLQQSAYAIASLLAISSFLVHSTVDFNFQIPSNAIYFFVFLAIALLQGMNSVHQEKRDTVWDEEIFNDSMLPLNNAQSTSKKSTE